MKVRFVSGGWYSSAYGVVITATGFETDDKQLIDLLRNSPDYGDLFHEVKTTKELKKDVKNFVDPVEVEPVEAGELTEESKLAEEQEDIRIEQEAAEEAEMEARRAAHEAKWGSKKPAEKKPAAKKPAAKKPAAKKPAAKKATGAKK